MNDLISTEEIKKDIRDTQIEINQMEREEKGFRVVGDRWSVMRADARITGIKERKEFIEKLERILKKEVRDERSYPFRKQ